MYNLEARLLAEQIDTLEINWVGEERGKRFAFDLNHYQRLYGEGRNDRDIRRRIAADLTSVIGYENSTDRVEDRILPMSFIPIKDADGYKVVTKGYDEERDLLAECATGTKQDIQETWVAAQAWKRLLDDYRLGEEQGFDSEEYVQREKAIFVWMSGPEERIGCLRESGFIEGRIQIGYIEDSLQTGLEFRSYYLPTVWPREDFERVGNKMLAASEEWTTDSSLLSIEELRKKALFIPRDSVEDVFTQIEMIAPEFRSYFDAIRSGEVQSRYDRILHESELVVDKVIMPQLQSVSSREYLRSIGASAEQMMVEDYGYGIQIESTCGEMNSDGAWLDGRGTLYGDEESWWWQISVKKNREYWENGKRYVYVKKCGFHKDNGGTCTKIFEKFIEVGSKCPHCQNVFVCA